MGTIEVFLLPYRGVATALLQQKLACYTSQRMLLLGIENTLQQALTNATNIRYGNCKVYVSLMPGLKKQVVCASNLLGRQQLRWIKLATSC